MKSLAFYRENLGLADSDLVFEYLITTLKPSLTLWSYFVNWEKVLANTAQIELHLNTLNYLVGHNDFDTRFRFLLKKHPEVIEVFPAILAVRHKGSNNKLQIVVDYKNKKITYQDFDFAKTNINDADIQRYLTFVTNTGIKDLFTSKRIKNLVDYMVGVETGLDTNARKNRTGDAMENVVEAFLDDLSNRSDWQYIPQATPAKIQQRFGVTVPVDKTSRKYDFALYRRERLVLVEVNFYGGGGSKLKSTAGEYRNLHDVLNGRFPFIWITDGIGWQTTMNPLRESFDKLDYLFNLSMLEHGMLDYLLIDHHL